MRFDLVSHHLPEPDGSAAGRVLLATGAGLRAEGHDVTAWSWRPEPPQGDVPDWCRWQPLPDAPAWRVRARALVHPRSDVARAAWRPRSGSVAVAEEPPSYAAAAVADGRSVTVLHYATALDVRALGGRWRPADVQHRRAEGRAVRGSGLVLAYSPRVAAYARRLWRHVPVHEVPAALEFPAPAPDPVDAPVAALLADWRWPPNRAALRTLLASWEAIRDAVPGARLRVAGRGDPGIGGAASVEVVGEVADSAAFLAEAGALVFPCPPTSGPKIKVLEAVALGVPVVTTPAGVEGLAVPDGSVAVASGAAFADAVVTSLRDVAARVDGARAARVAAAAVHAPGPAARARARACRTRT